MLSAVLVSSLTHGTLSLNADGSFIYTPAEYYSGSDSFTYKANDGIADSNIATVTITVTPRPQPTLPEALDLERSWQTGGSMSWIGQTLETHDGVDAAQAGPLADKQSSWLSTNVTGPATITFWWMTSSEIGDKLTVYVDGKKKATIGGVIPWQQKSINVSGGSHVVKWEFKRNRSGSAGLNAAFLDYVTITP